MIAKRHIKRFTNNTTIISFKILKVIFEVKSKSKISNNYAISYRCHHYIFFSFYFTE